MKKNDVRVISILNHKDAAKLQEEITKKVAILVNAAYKANATAK